MKRLIEAITNKRFSFKRYFKGGTYYGLNLYTVPLYGYGLCGYNVYVMDGKKVSSTITCNFERGHILIVNH